MMTDQTPKPGQRTASARRRPSSPLRPITATLAAFLATLALLVFQMTSGHDPALGTTAAPVARVAATSGASPALRTTASGSTVAAPTVSSQTVAARAAQTVSLVTRTSGGRSGRDDG